MGSSVAAADAFDDESLDVVYIDADHKWWSVLQDVAVWWPKVRPGGVMFGHDFHLNSLMEREGTPGGASNDVPLAVVAFFRAPQEVFLHWNFVWSVEKPHQIGESSKVGSGSDLIGTSLDAGGAADGSSTQSSGSCSSVSSSNSISSLSDKGGSSDSSRSSCNSGR